MIVFEIGLEKIEPWSLEYNNLYSITVSLKIKKIIADQVFHPLSYRNFELKNNKLFLNSKQVRLEGINYVFQDSLGTSLLDRNLILNDLLKIKGKGFNAIRVGYYPISPLFYDLTDSLGILCLQDLPFSLINPKGLQDSIGFTNLTDYITHYLATAEQHPSILGIGIGGLFKPTDLKDLSKMDSLYNLINNDGKFSIYACSFNPHVYNQRTIDFACLDILERNHV